MASVTYPVLSIMACNLLMVLMSTITLKLIFSIGECMLGDKWSNLHFNIVEVIMYMKIGWLLNSNYKIK